jgi:anti-sigma B factor antagonist
MVMHLTEKMREDVAVVYLRGDLLDENDEVVIQQKIRSLATDEIKKVVFDLGMVNRINSKGLSILISSIDTMHKNGGELRLARIDKNVHDLLTITNLIRVFGTYETVARATASFG